MMMGMFDGRMGSNQTASPHLLLQLLALVGFLASQMGESGLMLMPSVAAAAAAIKEKHLVPKYPLDKSIELSNGEHYILLNDDEILQNEGLLMHLVAASKEEVEEIVDGNPVLQQALLKKVKNIVDKKPQWEFKRYDDDYHKGVLVETVDGKHHPDGVIIYDGDDDEDEIAIKDKQSKLEDFKVKLRDKASKLYKIGASLKGKVNAMKQKKKRKHTRPSSHLPKLHVHVSTN